MVLLLISSLGNLVDRLFFGLSVFVWTDVLLMLVASAIFVINWKGHEIFKRRNNKSGN